MSPLPSRCSAPITSSTVRESTRVATRKLMRDGKFALISPVITSTLGRCVASTRCMPDGARHLRQARDAFFDVGAFQHHQVGQLVDQDQDVGNLFQSSLFRSLLRTGCAAAACNLAHLLVVLIDVANALRRQQFQAPLHFEHGVAQRVGGFLGVGDHRRQQVRDAFVRARIPGAWDPP